MVASAGKILQLAAQRSAELSKAVVGTEDLLWAMFQTEEHFHSRSQAVKRLEARGVNMYAPSVFEAPSLLQARGWGGGNGLSSTHKPNTHMPPPHPPPLTESPLSTRGQGPCLEPGGTFEERPGCARQRRGQRQVARPPDHRLGGLGACLRGRGGALARGSRCFFFFFARVDATIVPSEPLGAYASLALVSLFPWCPCSCTPSCAVCARACGCVCVCVCMVAWWLCV